MTNQAGEAYPRQAQRTRLTPFPRRFPIVQRFEVLLVTSPLYPNSISEQDRQTLFCPYCEGDLREVSPIGRENHIEYCRLILGVQDRRLESFERS